MIDFGKAVQDYLRYRVGFPPSFFERLAPYGVGLNEQTVLDLGSGTGTLAHGFAQHGCRVVALDPSSAMLHGAQHVQPLDTSLDYVRAFAESPPFADGAFDAVLAGQCWHWFDRPRVAQRLRHVLRPNGIIVIAHFDYYPIEGNIAYETQQLLEVFNPSFDPQSLGLAGQFGFYPQWTIDLEQAGYHDIETFSYIESVTYTHTAWRGRMRASAGVVSMDTERVPAFDYALSQFLIQNYSDPLHIPHRVWAVIAKN